MTAPRQQGGSNASRVPTLRDVYRVPNAVRGSVYRAYRPTEVALAWLCSQVIVDAIQVEYVDFARVDPDALSVAARGMFPPPEGWNYTTAPVLPTRPRWRRSSLADPFEGVWLFSADDATQCADALATMATVDATRVLFLLSTDAWESLPATDRSAFTPTRRTGAVDILYYLVFT